MTHEFFTPIATDTSSPFTQNWSATPGTYTLKAEAVDACGAVTSKSITVTVLASCTGKPAPLVNISNFANDDWIEPERYVFDANATDRSGRGIERVRFVVGSFSPDDDFSAPYHSGGYWLTTEGDVTVTATAFDGCGRSAVQQIVLHVSESASVCQLDDGPPWATFTSPATGVPVPPGNVTVRVNAGDDSVLMAAALEIDGVVPSGFTVLSSNPANYVWTWNATLGSHTLRVRLLDVCGKIGYSPIQTVQVQQPGVIDMIWMQPQALAGFGAPGSLTIAGSASGGSGSDRVTFRWRPSGGSWTTESFRPLPNANGIWYHSIPNANPNATYEGQGIFAGTTSASCTYAGNNAITWCP